MTTSFSPNESAAGAVVPVDLVAFCVSESEAVASTPAFSGATINYGALTTANANAYLGSSAARPFTFPALKPLEAGVHLHWALPDALTRANVSAHQSMDFPAAPNRWLVTRFAIGGGSATATSFVIESDALLDTLPAGHYAPLIPIKQAGSDQPGLAYLGNKTPLTSYQANAAAANVRAFRDATGLELTVVANGQPSFAAYYPDGRSSFGFVDTLADLGGAAQLMYVVTGWYDLAANDPATLVRSQTVPSPKGGTEPATMAGTYRWGGVDPIPAYTLYSGAVQSVAWDPNGSYIPLPGNQPTVQADAAVANTPVEALAAYFRGSLHPDVPYFEQILTAFQQGLWNKFTQPTPDVLAAIAESLHNSEFQRIDSNHIWTIFQADPQGNTSEAIELPQGIADALNAANAARAVLLSVGNGVESFRWRVFADWSRYFSITDPTEQSVVFDHLTQVLAPIWGESTDPASLQAQWAAAQSASAAADGALLALLKQRPDLSAREVPGPRYWQPSDPALLLSGPDLALSPRYGGDTSHSSTGLLMCRPTTQLVTSVSVNSMNKTASDFAAITQLPGSSGLPYLADCEALLAEACLLNTQIASVWPGISQPTLTSALQALVSGQAQSSWTIAAGTAPSPVALNWWAAANPWLPLFLQWSADFVALQPTVEGAALTNYDPAFFTANYRIDVDTGSFIAYTPSGPNSINIDPDKQNYTQTYQGNTMLSDSTATNLEKLIANYLATGKDPTLQNIQALLQKNVFTVQPLSGFTQALLNHATQQAQVALVAPDGASPSAQAITQAVASMVGSSYPVGPSFVTDYNPMRAGYLKFSAIAVDAFGQQRTVQIGSLYTAESMTTVTAQGETEPGIAYLAPRIAQPSRLLFQWMSAAATSVAEAAQHPAVSPVCGWLLPNHLTRGFFVYDGTGEPLGALALNAAATPVVVWQGAPGDDANINQRAEQALASANPLLSALVLSLVNATATYFQAFYHAVDTVHSTINPGNLALASGLSVLAGRPVALTQAAMRLDLQGRPCLNQNLACLSPTDWTDTDNGLSGVQFPVLLGDADRLDDGLVGFFRTNQGIASGGGDSFDLTTFFSAGAAPGATAGVVRPDATTLLLTPSPARSDPEPPSLQAETLRVLMLIDPRAPVHATTGILPTQKLAVPSDLVARVLSSLELFMLSAPVLQPDSGIALPAPSASGFSVSFVEQRRTSGNQTEWFTQPDITAPTANALWSYTPQSLTEGWLRLNPTQLTLALLNASGTAVVVPGANPALTLRISNAKPNTITFQPGVLAPEGTPPAGAIVYFHFGDLVAQSDVATMALSAPDWSFALQTDPVYGSYWSATPAITPVTLASMASIDVQLTGLTAASGVMQARVFFDYYALDGVANGVFAETVIVSAPS